VPVTIAQPLIRDVQNFEDFTGRVSARETVEIRARVTGYLEKIHFEEGKEVRSGETLFTIDPRPFQAVFDSASAQIELRKANLAFQEAEFRRNEELVKTKAVSVSEFEKSAASREQARASVAAATSETEAARLNLEFTGILARFDGIIGRSQIDEGNLVIADQTVLTTLVSVDPMQVLFDVDERRLLRIQKEVREGKLQDRRPGVIPVEIALDNDEGFPHRGTIDFIDNQLDPATGTIQLRGLFPNPMPERGKRVLTPGLYARVRIPMARVNDAVLIADQALGSDQGQKFVYVIDAQDEVQYRRVTVGKAEFGLRVVESGLKAGERVIVGGLQRVRPGAKVTAKSVEMSTFATAGWDAPLPNYNDVTPAAEPVATPSENDAVKPAESPAAAQSPPPSETSTEPASPPVETPPAAATPVLSPPVK
jgi:RND family efflux transporter MFP subunit